MIDDRQPTQDKLRDAASNYEGTSHAAEGGLTSVEGGQAHEPRPS